jgi:hypothetical protein
MLPRSLAAELKNSPARNKHHSKLFCLGWGAQQKELRNADIDRFLRRDCRPVDGIASPVAESECSVLSQEQCDGAAELHLSDDGAV